MKETAASLVGADAGRELGTYLDYISSGLGN
jgi:allophycocyanin beta subunit